MGRRARVQADLRRAMCTGKHQFDRAVAFEVARRMRRRARETEPAHAYRCRFCGGWHVGGQLGKLTGGDQGSALPHPRPST